MRLLRPDDLDQGSTVMTLRAAGRRLKLLHRSARHHRSIEPRLPPARPVGALEDDPQYVVGLKCRWGYWRGWSAWYLLKPCIHYRSQKMRGGEEGIRTLDTR